MNNTNLAKPRIEVADLQPYEPGMSIDALKRTYGIAGEVVKLASNENPFGASPKAIEILVNNVASVSNLYPDNHDFVDAIAEKHNVDKNMILVGNGSNDVLDIIARTYLDKGDEAISSQYGFIAYGIATKLSGATNKVVTAQEFGHDLNAMFNEITDKTKIVWIANPNNPTGTFLEYSELKKFIESVPEKVIVVLDEAYIEYLKADDYYNSIDLLNDYKNLIVVRTMSKIYGLAGLRLGYSIADSEVTNYMNRVRQPFNANTLALIAGTAALSDTDYVKLSKERNDQGMTLLTRELDSLGLDYIKSYGNFVTVKFEDADAVHKNLLREGIIVRPLVNYGMSDYLRFTIGKELEILKVVEALKAILSDKNLE